MSYVENVSYEDAQANFSNKKLADLTNHLFYAANL